MDGIYGERKAQGMIKSMTGYDSQTLSLIIHGDPQIYKYHDRDIYCRITADYKGKTITVRFKGTKIIGTKYKWSLENEDAFEVFKK